MQKTMKLCDCPVDVCRTDHPPEHCRFVMDPHDKMRKLRGQFGTYEDRACKQDKAVRAARSVKVHKYPKRTKEDFAAIFYVIRATKRYGWQKLARMMKDAGIDGSPDNATKPDSLTD